MFARPGLPSFNYVRATTPEQVVNLLAEHREAARLLMGGTDLFASLRDSVFRPRMLVDVKDLPGMREISYDTSQGLTVGAAVTMNQLACHPDVKVPAGLDPKAMQRFLESHGVRNYKEVAPPPIAKPQAA